MKLNVGASNAKGIYREKEWVNLDISKFNGIQVIGKGTSLPFKTDSFNEIHCVHVLEHLTRNKQEPFVKELYRTIKPGCPVYIEVPDFISICHNIIGADQDMNPEQTRIWTVSVYGKSERPGMAHHWGFTTNYLNALLAGAGFRDHEWLRGINQMISGHHKQEPVLLVKALK